MHGAAGWQYRAAWCAIPITRGPGADDRGTEIFFFDLRGWLVLPAVLSDGVLEAMRAECYAGVDPLQERPGGVKDGHSGVLQTLLDHPAVVGVLSEQPFDLDECYGFRSEDSHVIMRPRGWRKIRRGDNGVPHVVRPPQMANAMRQQVAGDKIFSGLTPVSAAVRLLVAVQLDQHRVVNFPPERSRHSRAVRAVPVRRELYPGGASGLPSPA